MLAQLEERRNKGTHERASLPVDHIYETGGGGGWSLDPPNGDDDRDQAMRRRIVSTVNDLVLR